MEIFLAVFSSVLCSPELRIVLKVADMLVISCECLNLSEVNIKFLTTSLLSKIEPLATVLMIFSNFCSEARVGNEIIFFPVSVFSVSSSFSIGYCYFRFHIFGKSFPFPFSF